jgi:DNA-binding transcriptional LysR family regulator
MNLNQLRFASAVARTKSFSAAAEACRVTQPTLSAGVAQLELELGAKLFERTTRHVGVTPFGNAIVPRIDQVLSALDDVKATAAHLLDPTHEILRVGVSPMVDMARVMKLLAPFQRSRPSMQIFFKECFATELTSRLLEEQIDLAIMPSAKDRRLHHVSLYEDPLLYLNAESPLGRLRSGVRLRDVKDDMWIMPTDHCGLRQHVDRMFAAARISPKMYRGQANTYAVMQEWADLGIGSVILPASKLGRTARAPSPLLDRRGEPLRVPVSVMWLRDANGPRHIVAARGYLLKLGDKHASGP